MLERAFVALRQSLTDPLVVAAFAVFALFFLFSKIVSKTKLFPQLSKQSSFLLLTRVVNVAAGVVVLVLLTSFVLALYRESRVGRRSADPRAAADQVAEIQRLANQFVEAPSDSDWRDRLRAFSKPVFELGKLLETTTAIETVRDLQRKTGLRELSPVLLALTPSDVNGLVHAPFRFAPSDDGRGRLTANYWYDDYDADDSQNLHPDASDAGVPDEYLRTVLSLPDRISYLDLALFVAGRDPQTWPDGNKSTLWDAGHYLQIRIARNRRQWRTAIEKGNEFQKLFPEHRHHDDAQVLMVKSAEALGDAKQAYRLAVQGLEMPDGDMRDWFSERLVRIPEWTGSSGFVEEHLRSERDKGRRAALTYTLAHHHAVEGNVLAAIGTLEGLLGRWKAPCDESFGDALCLSKEDVRNDVRQFRLLSQLRQQAEHSPEQRYDLGLHYYDNELVFYNRLFFGSRKMTVPTEATGYFERRNNYGLAAVEFERVARESKELRLVQMALYKLGRCYEHLSWSSSFIGDTFWERTRHGLAQKSVQAFARARDVYPTGPLADDALAEAGQASLQLLGNRRDALKFLNQVVDRYSAENAYDNALYLLAHADPSPSQRLVWLEKLASQVAASRLRELARSHLKDPASFVEATSPSA